ncbi:MAG: FMN-binding negative transcriptional regulator, partial [Pseudomonadota bacterium]
LELHLARNNPIVAATTEPTPAILSCNGPDGYVSPDWYKDARNAQVPTWNYVSVHVRGTLARLPDDALPGHLDRVSAHFETRLAPKRPWTAAKMPAGLLDRMMRAIVPFRFAIEAVDGTWKLNQNKDDDQRERAAQAIRNSPVGMETEALAQMMMGLGPQEF